MAGLLSVCGINSTCDLPANTSDPLPPSAAGRPAGFAGPDPWTTFAQVQTAEGMGAAAEELGATFALALGDNFYFSGISDVCFPTLGCPLSPSSNSRSDVHSARFNDSFESVFTAPSLQSEAGFSFYVVGGNHDHGGNITAQVEYSAVSPRWVFPSCYYTWSKQVDSRTIIQFVCVLFVLAYMYM